MTHQPNEDGPPEFMGTVMHDGCIAVYHLRENNRCPGCHKSNWDVREVTATCGFCGTVLPVIRNTPPSRIGE